MSTQPNLGDQKLMLQLRAPRLISALVVISAFVSACGGGQDQTQLERELQDKAGSDILPVELGLVDCPEDIVTTPESVFICASEVAGQYYELQVRILDAQGQYNYAHKHHPLQLVNTEAILATEVTYEVGFDVMIDCGDDEYLVAPIGSSFNCVATRVDGGAQATIEVRLEDAAGRLHWKLVRF
ncbi:MAG: hypothetical protein VX760_05685 [Actinomycetota bacterium]|nr:hypothetical protein [Actinomycetota bacterium]MED5362018.1 hypothetical protein [Actinomycetota bacterium]